MDTNEQRSNVPLLWLEARATRLRGFLEFIALHKRNV